MSDSVKPIQWDGRELTLLDQRRLPLDIIHIRCRTAEEVADAIRDMVVRGAPAIGVSAAFGLVLATQPEATGVDELRSRLDAAASALRATRPTAVNLAWALDRMMSRFEATEPSVDAIRNALEHEAVAIFNDDLEGNRRIGRYGSELLGKESTILTHCNAGALATAGYGTALGVIRAAHAAGKRIAVFAGETRPYLQGARLTAWELLQDGIDVTLITDNMAGHFFQQRKFDAVIVGADRIAANGDTANKIGTYTLAVLANAHGIPFYVAAPLSTIDLACASRREIPIEERSADEVTSVGRVRIAPEGVAVRHPAFDVTPAELITAIITDRGVARKPYSESLRKLF